MSLQSAKSWSSNEDNQEIKRQIAAVKYYFKRGWRKKQQVFLLVLNGWTFFPLHFIFQKSSPFMTKHLAAAALSLVSIDDFAFHF